MMTISLDDYEKIIDRVLSGNFSASDLSEFVKNTPVLPILAKFPFGKNEAVITVVVSDKKGNPVDGAKVIIAGETQTTNADGKAIFKFPFNVPPGFVIINKGKAISRIPFNGAKVGDKITLAAVIQEGTESPIAIGESLKDVINTYYQWKLIQNVENGVFNPNLSQFPQVGILKRKSDYEYQVYVPVPVNIKVPAINFTPVVGMPGMPPQPVPPEQPQPTPPEQPVTPPSPPIPPVPPVAPTNAYIVTIKVVPGHGAPSGAPITVSLINTKTGALVAPATGSYGVYTFKNIPPGNYKVVVHSPVGSFTKNVAVTNQNVEEVISVEAPTPTPHPVPPTPPPTLPPTSSGRGAIKVVIINPTNIPVTMKIDNGKYASKRVWRGTFTFGNIPAGMHVVDIYRSGRKVYSKSINVLPNQAAVIKYTVYSTPTPPTPKPPVPPTTPPPTPSVGGIKVVIPYTLPFDATIKIDGGRYGTKITRGGAVNFTNIPAGNHTVSVYRGTSKICAQIASVKPGMTAIVTCRPSVSPTPSPKPPVGGLPVIRAL